MSKRFIPAQLQRPLPDDLIKQEMPQGEDVVPLDVVFVGAGPAGLSGAIELARLCKADPNLSGIEIGILEKAGALGGHNLSGAVVNPIGFQTLFPQLKISDFPFRKKVDSEKVYMLTQNSSLRIPTPPTMKNHGNYVASICEIVRWLGTKAEELGVNVLTSFPADSLLVQGQKVVGVRTTPAGLKRDGQPGESAMPATDISANVVVLSEGTRGPLTQAFFKWQNIKAKYPQIYALGVKEIWKVTQAPKEVIHTLGWPLPKDAFGGSFIYPMSDNTVAFGLVAGLDYRKSDLDVHQRLQALKAHPILKDILKGGECIEWGAKTIPEGGFHSIPDQLCGDGALVIGDSAGFVNVPALKGIHYAMLSGILAARSIFESLKAQDFSKEKLGSYNKSIKESLIMSDLKGVRNMRHAFKNGFYAGGIKAGLMTLTAGAFPGDPNPSSGDHNLEDAEEWKEFSNENFQTPPGSLSKVDGVYLSGNKTRDDIPTHLLVGKDITGEVADFYSHVCPAGVYERHGDKLVINAPNCVDCKATDVLGPRWTPREGGSGPDYKQM